MILVDCGLTDMQGWETEVAVPKAIHQRPGRTNDTTQRHAENPGLASLLYAASSNPQYHLDNLDPLEHHGTNMSRAASTTKRVFSTPLSEQSSSAAALLHNPTTRLLLPFVNGGISGMFATTCIQPIDMVKVRLQLAGEGLRTGPKPTPFTVTREIFASGRGFRDLYIGLSAGLLRQAVYTTARIGFFDTFQNTLKARKAPGETIGFAERAAAGLTAGGLAAMVGNPADLALIRMQSDGLKPKELRANYTSVVNALTRITKTEGLPALWAGCGPTVVRAMALNLGQLAFFAEAKSQFASRPWTSTWSESTRTLGASGCAGFFASFFSLPFDFVKTRLQRQGARRVGEPKYYLGMADCFRKVAKEEGILRFYRGFGTYYVRIAPHAWVFPLFS